MHTRTATVVVITASLAVLMSGCAGAAAQGGQVRDDLRPAAHAAAIGLARGHVIVTDDLSPTRLTAESAAQVLRPDAARAWSAEARREFHAQQPVQSGTVEQQSFSAEVWRELKGSATVTVEQRPFSADAMRELKGSARSGTVEQRPFSAEAIRELKGSAPSGTVDDDQSPLGGSR